ncbi:hypothetical protein ACU8KH_04533 [Lachancea thermotolerans]
MSNLRKDLFRLIFNFSKVDVDLFMEIGSLQHAFSWLKNPSGSELAPIAYKAYPIVLLHVFMRLLIIFVRAALIDLLTLLKRVFIRIQ